MISMLFSCCDVQEQKGSTQSSFYQEECPSEYDSLLNITIYRDIDIPPKYENGDSQVVKLILDEINFNKYDYFQGSFIIELIINSEGKVITSNIKSKCKKDLNKIESDLLEIVQELDGWVPGYCNDKPVTSKKYLRIVL
jgi:hypothetical protein